MTKLADLWRRLTDAPATVVDPERRRGIQLLSGLMLVLIPLVLLLISIEAVLFPNLWPIFRLVLVALLLLLGVYGLTRAGFFTLAALIAVGVTFATSFRVVQLDPVDALNYAFLFINIFLAGLLFGEVGVWITGAATLSGVVLVLPAMGIAPPQGDPVVAPMFLTMTSALLLVGIRQRNAVERDRQAQLAAGEARFRALFHSSPVVMTLSRLKDSRLRDVNRAFEQWSGWSRETVIGRSTLDLGFWPIPEERARVRQLLSNDGSGRDVEVRVRIRSGEMRDLLCSFEPLQLQDEECVLVTVVDITARQQAEQETRRLNHLLGTLGAINPVLMRAAGEAQLFTGVCRTLVEQGRFSMAWIGIADPVTRQVRVACQTGFRHGYLESLDIRYDDSPLGQGPTGTAIRGGQTVINDDTETNPRFAPWRERAREHGYRSSAAIPLRVHGEVIGSLNVYALAPQSFGNQEVVLLEKLAGDIGLAVERLRAMSRIEASERELATILQNLQDTYYRTDAEGRIVRASAAATNLLGYSPQEMEGRRLADFYVDPEGRAQFLAALQAAGGALRNYDAALRHRDGTAVWVSTNAQYVRDADGRVIGVEGTVRNVSERKQAEQALVASEANFRAVTENANVGILVNHRGRHVFANKYLLRMLDYSMEQLSGTGVRDLVAPEHFDAVMTRFEERMTGKEVPRVYETVFMTRGGTPVPVELTAAQTTWQGEPAGLVFLRDIRERKAAEAALRASEAEYRHLFENMTSGFALHEIICDDQGKPVDYRYLQANPAFEKLTGVPVATLIGKRIREILPNTEEYWIETFGKVALTGEPMAYENFSRELGKYYDTWVFSPQKYQFAVIFTDITQRKVAEAEMGKLSSAVEQIADTVMITSREGVIEYVNPAFEHTTGYTRAEAVGQTPRLLKSGRQGMSFYQKLWKTILAGESFDDVFINRRKDGSLYYEEKTISPLKDGSGQITHFVSTGKDVTERIQAQEQLQHMAQHDALTELPNRALLLDRLKQSMARARWHQRLVAVLFVDLDRFKTINDTLGHDVGDRLLQQLAERFGRCVREGDTVARFGGDEFVILLDDVASEQDVGGVAQKALDVLATPFTVDNQKLYITASIGVSLFPNDGEDSNTLLKNADIAMYRAKELGKNTYQFYSSDMSARAFERLSLETSLRNGLERREFVLHYQPQIDTDSGRIIGVEALIRWQHPDFGLVPPADFIPLLEETGLIVPAGEWVLDTACKQLHAWHQAGWPELRLAVNLSPRQFHAAGLETAIERSLDRIGRDPGLLELEITEGVILSHTRASLDTLAALHELGVRLAVDDFGTGYSSLSYLRRFPIDSLKIDRSFVQDIPEDPDDSAITTTIIVLAQNLKLDVIAEGVENAAQRDFLRSQGCRLMQGYLFSQPLPADELTRLLERQPATGRAAGGG